ncbi:MAG: hypothetical protein ABIJ16_02335 [Bacteroidota bacterium]
MKSKIILAAIIILSSSMAFTQWECRSKLGAHLKPFKKDFPLLWAIEQTSGHGYMNDRNITNLMVFAGLDYSFKKNQFYIEGGSKGWHNSLGAPENYNHNGKNRKFIQQQRFGIREGFYKFKNDKIQLTAGFHSMGLGDLFLVNERGLGFSYRQEAGHITISFTGASILKDFSRFGSFCSVHYLYNVLRDREYAYLGDEIGETNFAGMVIKWKPSHGNNDIASGSEKKKSIIDHIGLILYSEFGTGIDTMKTDYGVMTGMKLPGKLKLGVEALHQYHQDNQALLYFADLSREFKFGSYGQTILSAGYIGLQELDDNAMGYASFSNLFIGEVMRLDLMDIPLYQFAARHRIPKWSSMIKIQTTQQFTDRHISEYDIAVGKTFFKHAKLTLMFCRMDADDMPEVYYMGRGEIRITF